MHALVSGMDWPGMRCPGMCCPGMWTFPDMWTCACTYPEPNDINENGVYLPNLLMEKCV